MTLEHNPVMVEEIIKYLNCKKDGIYVDGTLGRGGHTQAILKEIGEEGEGKVIGIDRDKEAVKQTKKLLKSYSNLELFHDNFINIPQILNDLKIKKVEGMIFDLGVSSPQIEAAERGFSYSKEGPLDMRMNTDQKKDAGKIVNNYSKDELTQIFRNYGEEKWSSRIADFIIEARKRKKIEKTTELVSIIKDAIPASARRKGGHPARRTFQALRIETNNELKQLENMIYKIINFVKVGGRICIISFHSLEDRIVKHSFRELAKDCICPPDFPICVCDKEAEVKVLTSSPVRASKKEVEENPRARSAKLRVAEKLKT